MMNIFDALNIFYREDVISDFLKSCFEDSEDFLRKFFQESNIFLPDEIIYQIKNRAGLGIKIGIPDIIVVSKSSEQNDIIIIENKLGASEGGSQTFRYESEDARIKLLNIFNLEQARFHFIYLTLDSTVKPVNQKFISLNYKIFLSDNWILYNSKLGKIFSDFREKLMNFYKPLKNPFYSLENEVVLDQTQKVICWQSVLFNEMKDMQDVELVWGTIRGSGRLNFLFRVNKENWKSSDNYEVAGLAKTFDIHVDTFIDLLSSSKNLLNEINIRFETNPYTPHKNILHDEQYQEFIANKYLFAKYLSEYMTNLDIDYNSRNYKLMVMNVPLSKSTLKENISDYKCKTQVISQAVDFAVEKLKKDVVN